MSVCKDCTLKVFDNFQKTYKKDAKKSVLETCRLLDMYFEDGIIENVIRDVTGTKDNIMRKYITKINSMSGVKNLSFIDSKISSTTGGDLYQEVIDVPTHLLEKWNTNHPAELYDRFEKLYNEIAPIYNVDNPMKRIYLIDFVKNSILADYHLSKGDIAKSKEYNAIAKDKASSGQLSPKEFSKISTGGINSVSELIKEIEKEVDIVEQMPIYLQQPKDKIDFVMWCLINYLRRLEDLPEVEYKDIWEFYNKMENDRKGEILDFVQEYSDKEFSEEDGEAELK